jgi:hypothetical protein
MNKSIVVATLIPLFLAACSTMPVDKTIPVQGALKNTTSIRMSLPADAVQPRVGFNVTGYTIIGVAYVAAAAATMNSHSEAIDTAYNKYLQAHPEVPTLKDAFNNELKKALQARGVNSTFVQVKKTPGDDMHVAYAIDGGLQEQKVVVVDGLTSQYFAIDSGSDYHPRSSVLVSIFEPKDLYTKPVNRERLINLADADAYPNFETLSADPTRSYAGLLSNVEMLADKVAESLYK